MRKKKLTREDILFEGRLKSKHEFSILGIGLGHPNNVSDKRKSMLSNYMKHHNQYLCNEYITGERKNEKNS